MISDAIILTRGELEGIDYDVFLNIPITFHEHEMKKHLDGIVDPELRPNEHKLASLLSLLFSFNLQVVGGSSVFEPQMILGNKRTILPEDFDIKINECLLNASRNIKNPFLLSRLCDVIWCNDKKNREIAVKAIDSYAMMINEAIDKLVLHNKNITEDDLSSFLFIRGYIARALFINSRVYSRKSGGNENIAAAIQFLYDTQVEKLIFEGFNDLTSTMMRYYPKEDRLQYAKNAEKMADTYREIKYYDAVKALYFTSARIYEKNGQPDSARRCRLSLAGVTIRVANARADKMGKVAWLRTAISELRQFGGDTQLIDDLKKQLVDLREEVSSEYVTFSHTINISELVEITEEQLKGSCLADIFKVVVTETPIENIEKMKDEVKESAGRSFFSSFFGMEVHDEAGRKIHKAPPLDMREGISDEAVIDRYLRTFEINHQIFINSVFEPARYIIFQEHGLTLSTFIKLVSYSPIIKPEFKDIFNLGFYRLWQGDYISASYILIPQMEGIIRHCYELSGKDATRYLDKELEESTSISILFDKCRDDIESIFSKNLALTIDLVFNRKGGPILRHKLAHGNLYTGSCYAETTTYACMLVFYLCAYPLLPYFDEIFDKNSET
ncbi:hypothetical protein RAG00_15035 [Klebsiella variicola subsp. variicola]|uniref:DUF7380 domain-containing protein n=1 Tax=Klebsiella pneumoniae complex TaxID=3390273 RepID=UPI00234CF2D9|nr:MULTISPECIES: hypothetical protein [Klebsiella]MDC6712281.1 hypothetical protein [Klebsiella pneumoniae]